MKSPCVGACKNNGGICSGCYRTMNEIMSWKQMSDKQRERIMTHLPYRNGLEFDLNLTDQAATNKCPRCGEALSCDIQAGKESCWCFDVEKRDTSILGEFTRCLCRKCLMECPVV